MTESNGKQYVLSTDSFSVAPNAGYVLAAAPTTNDAGTTVTDNGDGTYTVSGVTQAITVTLDVIEVRYPVSDPYTVTVNAGERASMRLSADPDAAGFPLLGKD